MSLYHGKKKLAGRERRKVRVRKKVFGTADIPRLNVFRSAKHIYAQVVDDEAGKTLASASTVAKDVRTGLDGDKTAKAKQIGLRLAELCKSKNVNKVVFDRNGFQYHGRVKAVAEGAREGGLQF